MLRSQGTAMTLVNYVVYVRPDDVPLVFHLDKGEATPIAMDAAPGRVVQYARSLEAWANARPIPPGGLPAEFFTGMREVCPMAITVAVDEAHALHLH